MFSIFSRFQGISHAGLLATKRIVLLSSVSMTRRLLARMLEPVSVRSTMRIEQAGFDFGGAPGKFDGHLHAALGEILARDVHQLGGDDLPFQILGLVNRRFHPAPPAPTAPALPVARE